MQETARRVAFVTTSYPNFAGDPAGHFVECEAQELRARGHHLTVLAPSAAEERRENELWRLPGGDAFGPPGVLVRLTERPSRFPSAVRWMHRARAALRTLRPDEVVAHWLVPSLWPVALGAACPVRAVAHGSDVALLLRLPRPALRHLFRGAFAHDVRFRFVSRRLLSELGDALGPRLAAMLHARSRIEPCPIDTADTPSRSEARARLELDDRFLALSIGRLVPAKRVEWALRHAPVPAGTRWVVIGDGPERPRLERAHPEVTFLGALDRRTTLCWLSAADLLVHASEREGAPTVVREARQLGTQVWCSDVGDVREWAEHDPGLLVLPELGPA